MVGRIRLVGGLLTRSWRMEGTVGTRGLGMCCFGWIYQFLARRSAQHLVEGPGICGLVVVGVPAFCLSEAALLV
jgi:hypothetical protein